MAISKVVDSAAEGYICNGVGETAWQCHWYQVKKTILIVKLIYFPINNFLLRFSLANAFMII